MILFKKMIVTKRIWIGTMSGNNNSPNNTIASQNPRNLEMILFSFNCHHHPRTFFSIKVYDKKKLCQAKLACLCASQHCYQIMNIWSLKFLNQSDLCLVLRWGYLMYHLNLEKSLVSNSCSYLLKDSIINLKS